VVHYKATVDDLPEEFRARTAIGTPEAIAEQIKTKVFDAGVGGVIFNMPGDANLPGYVPGVLAEVGAALRSVLP
jgi:alkanesulfonate monooxygenase SsuD/methylene tetrahydromethanopterin reductase-like flavin-dependent oxidoreductase (luciferase family)